MARGVTRGTMGLIGQLQKHQQEKHHSSWLSVQKQLFLLKWECLVLGELIMMKVQTMKS